MEKVIGLTGGIASGKSVVTTILREAGYPVIDADALVHELQQPGGRLYQAILSDFGPAYFEESTRKLDRSKLAQLVFSDSAAFQRLSALQDQLIRAELKDRKQAELARSGQAFFMDIPLLFEENYDSWFDEIWLVATTEALQIERLQKRSALTWDEARARIAHQMPLAEKVSRADVVLDNTGSFDTLKVQVMQAIERINNK